MTKSTSQFRTVIGLEVAISAPGREKLEKKHALRGDPDMERLDWAPAAPASSQVKGRD